VLGSRLGIGPFGFNTLEKDVEEVDGRVLCEGLLAAGYKDFEKLVEYYALYVKVFGVVISNENRPHN
jgi:hypothetical protein